jgi:hypothetical protein
MAPAVNPACSGFADREKTDDSQSKSEAAAQLKDALMRCEITHGMTRPNTVTAQYG